MGATAQNLLLLFDRPNEPIFTPKGDQGAVFNVPEDYLEERFKGSNVVERFGSDGDRINVNAIRLPTSEFTLPKTLGKRDFFSLFIPEHRKMAGKLIEIFMGQTENFKLVYLPTGMKSLEDLQSCAAYGRANLNPQLFNYALSVALLHRSDTKNLDLPQISELFPDKYMDGGVFRRAREEAEVSNQIRGFDAIPLEIPLDYTASNLEEEHRVAYFREDVGINLHHWHWHLVYPFDGPQNIVGKDRRGELFYYMHQQIIARYNAERLSNKLARVGRFTDFRQPIREGYFPKLDSLSASRNWASRIPNTLLRDINRNADQIRVDIQTLERWRDRLYEAAQTGRITDSNNQSVQLTEAEGIDILGNLIEASVLSRNRNFYGDLHNLGHVAISYSHDPDNRHLETFSVMGDSATAMRDPIFYRWHAFIDDIFQSYKNTLPTYTAQQLNFDGVTVTGLEINSSSGKNVFNTFWQQSDVNLSRGLDFSPRSNVFARFTHLQHTPFEYVIRVNNTGAARQGTVRIFMAPKFDERDVDILFNDQRKLMIELDKFVVDLKPQQNVITQRSSQSSVTIPFNRTFRDLNNIPQTNDGLAGFNFCGCGWPEHMLIPKGNAEGFAVTIFVMVSDYQNDRVDNPPSNNQQCRAAVSYCGLRDSRYPDRQSMGYPFDRVGRPGVDTLRNFLTGNMRTQDVNIRFSNRVQPPGLTPGGQRPGQNKGQRQPSPQRQRPRN